MLDSDILPYRGKLIPCKDGCIFSAPQTRWGSNYYVWCYLYFDKHATIYDLGDDNHKVFCVGIKEFMETGELLNLHEVDPVDRSVILESLKKIRPDLLHIHAWLC
jgi:hypothetical protein